MYEPTRCHRCGTNMTIFVVGDDYCRECKREIAARDAAAKRAPRFPFAKEIGPGKPAA